MPRRSWAAGLTAALCVAGAGAAVALAIHPGSAAAAPNQSCDQTMVVVEWHEAAPDKDLSARCVDPGENPFDALKNAKLSPITQVETAVGTVLCSILNVPATHCDQLPPHAAWTYWYVDPATREWHGPYESPPDTAATAPSPDSARPGAATGPQPSTAPPVEDWVYQSDYPAHPVKPAYDVQGTPPTSTPSSTASSSPAPSTDPTPSAIPPVPSVSDVTAPSLPVAIPPRHRSTTPHRSHPASPRPTGRLTSKATTTDVVGRADGFVPPQYQLPQLPDVSPPDQWWIAADRPTAAAMTREGQASNTAWATAAPGDDSAHRVAWSTGLGAAAVVLLGIGIGAQVRRRRSG